MCSLQLELEKQNQNHHEVLRREAAVRQRIREEWERQRLIPYVAPKPKKPKKPKAETGHRLGWQAPPAHRKFRCACCAVLTHLCNRHHPLPLQIRRTSATVRICFECHDIIHALDNPTLATMSWPEQRDFIHAFLLNYYA